MRLGSDLGKTLPGSTEVRLEGGSAPVQAPRGGSGFVESLKKGQPDHSISSFAKVIGQDSCRESGSSRASFLERMWASSDEAKKIVSEKNRQQIDELTRSGADDPIARAVQSLAQELGHPLAWKDLLPQEQLRFCSFVRDALANLGKTEASPSRSSALATLEKAVRLQLTYLSAGREAERRVAREGSFVQGKLGAESIRKEINWLLFERIGKAREEAPPKELAGLLEHLDSAFFKDVPRNDYFIGGEHQNREDVAATLGKFSGLFRKDGQLDVKTMDTVSSILNQNGNAFLTNSTELRQALAQAGLKMGMPQLALGYNRYSIAKETNGSAFLLKIESQGIPAQGVPQGKQTVKVVGDVLNSKGFLDCSLSFRVTPPPAPDAPCGIEVLDTRYAFRLE